MVNFYLAFVCLSPIMVLRVKRLKIRRKKYFYKNRKWFLFRRRVRSIARVRRFWRI